MKRHLVVIAATLCLALPAHAAKPPTMAEMAEQLADMSEQLAELQGGMSDLTVTDSHALKINGYFEMAYGNDNRGDKTSHFRQHHLSTFFSRNWEHWRLFTEIEYEDGVSIGGKAPGSVTGTGKVQLERGWIDYIHSDALKVRMGKFLLPQYWKVNHYPNAVLTSERPIMVRKLFPTDGTGVLIHGDLYRGGFGLGYNTYVSNGNAANPSGADDNDNKATGARLTLHLADQFEPFDRLDLGGSFHNERSPNTQGGMDVSGADLQANAGRFELLAEYAHRHDNSAEGYYVQPSVRLAKRWYGVYRFDWMDTGQSSHHRHTLGSAWRPMPNLAFKADVSSHHDNTSTPRDFQKLNLSVALFF